MLTKSRILGVFVLLVAGTILLSGVGLTYAHCGKCLMDARAMADELTSSKMMLVPAIVLAEQSTKGTAVKATCHPHADGTFIEVHCVAGEKIMAVAVDPKSGKILRSGEVATLESHASEEAGQAAPPASSMNDAGIPAKLDEVASLSKVGKFDEALAILEELEGLKDVSETTQSKIEAARIALDTSKVGKVKLPSIP